MIRVEGSPEPDEEPDVLPVKPYAPPPSDGLEEENPSESRGENLELELPPLDGGNPEEEEDEAAKPAAPSESGEVDRDFANSHMDDAKTVEPLAENKDVHMKQAYREPTDSEESSEHAVPSPRSVSPEQVAQPSGVTSVDLGPEDGIPPSEDEPDISALHVSSPRVDVNADANAEDPPETASAAAPPHLPTKGTLECFGNWNMDTANSVLYHHMRLQARVDENRFDGVAKARYPLGPLPELEHNPCLQPDGLIPLHINDDPNLRSIRWTQLMEFLYAPAALDADPRLAALVNDFKECRGPDRNADMLINFSRDYAAWFNEHEFADYWVEPKTIENLDEGWSEGFYQYDPYPEFVSWLGEDVQQSLRSEEVKIANANRANIKAERPSLPSGFIEESDEALDCAVTQDNYRNAIWGVNTFSRDAKKKKEKAKILSELWKMRE